MVGVNLYLIFGICYSNIHEQCINSQLYKVKFIKGAFISYTMKYNKVYMLKA
jgi:hypothetical protein